MSEVLIKVPVALRGKMATQLLEAAETLGLEPAVVRSQTEGFRVPTEVHEYLYPSSYENDDETPVSTQVNDEGDIPGESSDPAADFDDLTPEEQDKLTNPATDEK